MRRNQAPKFAGRAYDHDMQFQGYILAIAKYEADYFDRKWALCLIQTIGAQFEDWFQLDNIMISAS